MGFFEKLKTGLKKTHDNIFARVDKLIYGKSKIDEDFLGELEEILLSSDVGVLMAEKIIGNLKSRVKEEKYESPEQLSAFIRDEIKKIFIENNGSASGEFRIDKKPYVIIVVGVNGSGKTTSIGKLAYNYKNSAYTVLIGAADTFRAAANEQLEVWAKRSGTEIIQLEQGADPGAVVYNTLNRAIAKIMTL